MRGGLRARELSKVKAYLVDGLLALIVATTHAGAALPAHSINLINEDDARGLGLGLHSNCSTQAMGAGARVGKY